MNNQQILKALLFNLLFSWLFFKFLFSWLFFKFQSQIIGSLSLQVYFSWKGFISGNWVLIISLAGLNEQAACWAHRGQPQSAEQFSFYYNQKSYLHFGRLLQSWAREIFPALHYPMYIIGTWRYLPICYSKWSDRLWDKCNQAPW